MEVLADDDELGPKAVDQHVVHELIGALVRAVLVEDDDDRGVDAGLLEQFELLRQVRQQPRRRFRAYDRRRVAVEGEHDRLRAELRCVPADVGDHGLVPEMDAVVGTDGDDRPLAGPWARRQIVDDVHGRRRYPSGPPLSTTAGFASPLRNAS